MKKVVVVGGGFAGTQIAKSLEKNFEVTLVDSKDFFEFTPGILRTIVEIDHMNKICVKHVDYLKNTNIIIGCVNSINKKFVKVKDKEIHFDYLAICSGSTYNLPIKEMNIFVATRAKHLKDAYNSLINAKNVLIIGGGLVGVELAAEIATHWKNKKIKLVHSKDRLVPRNNIKVAKYFDRFLSSRGVEIIYGERIKNFKKTEVESESGLKIKTDIIFYATGITPNSEFLKNNYTKSLNNKGYVKVNDFLQISGEKNILAAGDVNNCDVEKTAQNAEVQANIIVKNIKLLNQGKKLKKYKYKKRPLVISLGKYDGVFEWGNFILKGKIAGLLKWGIEKKEMWKRS